MTARKLDEKRLGLLVRMSFHRACICRRATQEPLLRRGLTRKNNCNGYELTADGKKFVADFLAKNPKGHLKTWSGISIGSEVIILKDGREGR